MIEHVTGLRRIDGDNPPFFELTFRESGQGEGYKQTFRQGSEKDLREFMVAEGISSAVVDEWFKRVV